MPSEPPDLDEVISFAVDDGAQAGPFPMRDIVESVKSGQRSPSTLIWWAGESDWVPFESIPGLMSLTIPPPPAAPVVEPPAPEDPTQAVTPEAESVAGYEEVTTTFQPETIETHDPVGVAEADEGHFGSASLFGSSATSSAASIAGIDDLLENAPTDLGAAPAGEGLIEEVIPANAGVFDTSVEQIEDQAIDAVSSVAPTETESAVESDPIDEVVESATTEAPDTGSFAGAEVESDPITETVQADVPTWAGADLWPESPLPDIEPATTTGDIGADTPTDKIFQKIEDRSPLESVGERIQALGADPVAEDLLHSSEAVPVEHLSDDLPTSSEPSAAEPDVVEPDVVEPDVAEPDVAEPVVAEMPSPSAVFSSDQPALDELDTSFLTEPVTEVAAAADPPAPSGEPVATPQTYGEPVDVSAAAHAAHAHTPYDEEANVADHEQPAHVGEPAVVAGAVSTSSHATEAVGATMSAAAATATSQPAVDAPVVDDEELEAEFAEMVKTSWAHYKRVEWASRLDDVMLGGLITATLDNGYALIDLTSTGTNHYVRFEHPDDESRITMGIEHLTPSATEGEVLGHHASVVIGWGKRVADAGTALQAVKEEMKGSIIQTPEPGTVTVEADLTSGYAYTQIDLIWAIEEYVERDYSVDHARLSRSVDAAVHSLRKYWYGRFVAASS